MQLDEGTKGERLPRNVWIVTITSFLTDISSEMLTNLLPLFLVGVLGVRTSVIGLIEGVAETTASLLKVFSGWLSDRVGVRKRLALLGYGLSTVSKPFLYIASNWAWVLGVRFFDRVGKGVRTAPRDALLADSVGEDRRGLAFGLHRAGDTAGAVLGLVVTLVVLRFAQQGSISLTQDSFRLIVLLSLIPAALAVLVLAIGAREVPPSRESSRLPTLRLMDFDRRYLRFLLIIVLFTLGNSSDAFLILRAQTAGLSVFGILGMMLTFNVVYSLVSAPAGALSDRIGRRRLLILGWLIYALVYLGFARASAGWHAWLLMTVYGLYYGLTEGVAKALIADLVPSDQRARAYGIYSAAVGLTAFPASLTAGLLWQGAGNWGGLGPSAPFLFGFGMAITAALLLAFSSVGRAGHVTDKEV
ncbi:MAG: MFS transporter [Anaerolineales bacterium]|jgi:MFS family permease